MKQANRECLRHTVALFGAAPDTSNLGCSALLYSTILGIRARLPKARIAIADFGRGFRPETFLIDDVRIDATRFASVNTRRIYRQDSIYNMAICSALGGLRHPAIELLREVSAVLDISGGDSFSDIYGSRFFRSNTLRKRLVLREGAKLILLPQTYGPYNTRSARRVAEQIVRKCAMAWARDSRSYSVLKELLGDAFDSSKHRLGVDVAFGLPAVFPSERLIHTTIDWLQERRVPLVGLNISGLLLNRPDIASGQYGIKANYLQTLTSLISRLLKESEARILLVPHVLSPLGHYESDVEACGTVAASVAGIGSDRIAIMSELSSPCEAKWVISQCDWFCGTRMHSTIAALSSGIPAAGIAYSAKTLGVFETCGQGAHVADPRRLTTEEMVDHLWQSWCDREKARRALHAALPSVIQRASAQMDEIVAAFATSTGSS